MLDLISDKKSVMGTILGNWTSYIAKQCSYFRIYNMQLPDIPITIFLNHFKELVKLGVVQCGTMSFNAT